MPRNSTASLITSAAYGQRPKSPSEFGYIRMMLTINEILAAMPPNEKENSTMTAEPTGPVPGTGASARQSDGHHDRCGGRQRAPDSQRDPEECKRRRKLRADHGLVHYGES